MPDDERARSGTSAPSTDPSTGTHPAGRDGPGGPGTVVGRLLEGRYLVGPRIARGGMASVHEAHDVRLDRVVAVKIMHTGLADVSSGQDDFAERFVREARAAARLTHPHVVAVYDQGDDDGTVFLVMELVTGHTLRDTVTKESPMGPARALALLEPVLSALAAAHRSGLVHRDVKPENVLIADDGRVKVADFGLAKAISADTQHTATQGVLIGTVSYLAPELVVDGRADARADVYAAGVVLYELLTGTKPHAGETPIAVAYKHVHHDVAPPSALVPGLPAYVDALVAGATARDRDRRPADAGVLLHRVRRVAQALAEGVREDPDLVADLAPTATGGRPGEGAVVGTDTTPEPWIADPWPVRQHTQTLTVGADRPAELATGAPAPAGPQPPRSIKSPKPPRPPKPPRTRRSRRGPVLLVLALVLALAVGGGAFWFGYARYTTSPSVLAMPQGDAERSLSDAGLRVGYAEPVYDAEAGKGTVVAADPGGGARVLPGDTVTLTLSLGRDAVPRVATLSEDAAQDRLQARQLEFGRRVGRYSEKVPRGQVVTSHPAPGTQVDPGTVVDLVVSKGRRPIPVRSWVGKPADQARTYLSLRGLQVSTTEAYDDSVPAGAVVSQDPVGGRLHLGDRVSLVVSRGPELVEVPSVKGYGLEAATQTLEAAGFRVTVQHNDLGYYGLNFAVGTDPEPGTMAPKGSTITVVVV